MELSIIELIEMTEQIENAFSTIEQERTEKFLVEINKNIEEQKALRERARRARKKDNSNQILSTLTNQKIIAS